MSNGSPAPAGTLTGRPLFPFSAVVGQERMKLALLLNAIDPGVGGVLIRGEKGTAKSTVARALARVLPEVAVHEGCAFACDPTRPGEWCPSCRASAGGRPIRRRRARLVTLPLSATEDMVAGGLDLSRAMKGGKREFQPGVLGRVHRGVLYIDEVNLLDDHLVDLILDAAESGINVVEREGLSVRHPARFAMVASMNPEEGSLRPQLLDRFGLCVEVVSEPDPRLRVLTMERRESYEEDPGGFCDAFAAEESALSNRLREARALLPAVRTPRHLLAYISELAAARHVAGHRADIAISRAARAHAALAGRSTVETKDVLEVAEMALLHRGRDASPPPPPPPQGTGEGEPEKQVRGEEDRNDENDRPQPSPEGATPPPPPGNPAGSEAGGRSGEEALFDVGEVFRVKGFAPLEDRLARRGSGRRLRTRTEDKQGRYVRSGCSADYEDLAFDATLRAAAPHQLSRRAATGRQDVVIYRRDLQKKVRERKIGSFILFVVDASGSMGARGRMAASKGAVMSLLLDAYQKRDRLAMISFRRQKADLLLPPTSSVDVAGKLLREMAVGGRTPLSAGLTKAYETLTVQLRRDPNLRPVTILVTDGKANVGLDQRNRPIEEALRVAERVGRDRRVHWIVVDTEKQNGVRLNLAGTVASALGGSYCRIDSLRASDLVTIIKGT